MSPFASAGGWEARKSSWLGRSQGYWDSPSLPLSPSSLDTRPGRGGAGLAVWVEGFLQTLEGTAGGTRGLWDTSALQSVLRTAQTPPTAVRQGWCWAPSDPGASDLLPIPTCSVQWSHKRSLYEEEVWGFKEAFLEEEAAKMSLGSTWRWQAGRLQVLGPRFRILALAGLSPWTLSHPLLALLALLSSGLGSGVVREQPPLTHSAEWPPATPGDRGSTGQAQGLPQ